MTGAIVTHQPLNVWTSPQDPEVQRIYFTLQEWQ